MARYDFECIVCGQKRLDIQVNNWHDATHGGHREFCSCGGEMRKLPCAPNFRVTGYNAANHYGAKP